MSTPALASDVDYLGSFRALQSGVGRGRLFLLHPAASLDLEAALGCGRRQFSLRSDRLVGIGQGGGGGSRLPPKPSWRATPFPVVRDTALQPRLSSAARDRGTGTVASAWPAFPLSATSFPAVFGVEAPRGRESSLCSTLGEPPPPPKKIDGALRRTVVFSSRACCLATLSDCGEGNGGDRVPGLRLGPHLPLGLPAAGERASRCPSAGDSCPPPRRRAISSQQAERNLHFNAVFGSRTKYLASASHPHPFYRLQRPPSREMRAPPAPQPARGLRADAHKTSAASSNKETRKQYICWPQLLCRRHGGGDGVLTCYCRAEEKAPLGRLPAGF